MIHDITNALLNFLLVSVLEEFVWLLITIILLKRFDLLDRYRWKESMREFLIPILPTALYINLSRYVLHMPRIIILFGCIFIFYGLTLYIIKKNSFIDEKLPYLKILMFVFIGILIIGITELIYMPIILYIIQQPVTIMNQNILMNLGKNTHQDSRKLHQCAC